jgi:superfamily I DNA/RNA helicase
MAQEFRLTHEQREAIDASLEGDSTKIEAGPGTGKTETLVTMAKYKARMHGPYAPAAQGRYLAYNRKMADEARTRLPKNCQASTVHGLAYREVGQRFAEGRLGMRIPARRAAEIGGVLGDQLFLGKPFSQAAIGYVMLDWVSRFCQSADPVLGLKHFPTGSFLGHLTEEDQKNREGLKRLREQFARETLGPTQKLWERMSNINEDISVPTTHDVYLKLWVMSEPKIKGAFFLLDEAQDANPLMLQLMAGQDGQAIYVGDRYQQLYSWRGAVNAMAEIQTKREVWLTQSFRFGQDVADVANSVLVGMLDAKPILRGNPEKTSVVRPIDGAPDFLLCRTNAAAVESAIAFDNRGHSVELRASVSGMKATLRGARELADIGRTEHQALCNFQDFSELREYVSSGAGKDLKVLVDLIDQHGFSGAERLLDKLGNTDGTRQVDVAVGTVHGAKGLQWPRVRLADDFMPRSNARFSHEEGHALFVAVTRAESELDVQDCTAVQELLENEHEDASFLAAGGMR